MAELAYAIDLKSVGLKAMWVRVPPRLPNLLYLINNVTKNKGDITMIKELYKMPIFWLAISVDVVLVSAAVKFLFNL